MTSTNTKEKTRGILSMHPRKFAFWLFMVTVTMIFAAFTSAYLVRREAGDWKFFDLPAGFIWSTIVIVLSSVTHQLAYWAAKKDELPRLKGLLVATFVLGIAFIYFQVTAWGELTRRNIFFAANASHGITAQYFTDNNFERRVAKQIDSIVDFDWKDQSPAMNARADSFSVLWIGLVEAPENGEYTFYLTTDNVRRLWIDENLILHNTVLNTTGTSEGKVSLVKGKKHAIKLEYVEDTGSAQARLEWSGPGIGRQVVPNKYLWTVTPANASESFLYVITGIHALHIISAIVFLLVVIVVAFKDEIHSRNLLRIELCTTYWHFLGLLWVYLYVFLYLNQ